MLKVLNFSNYVSIRLNFLLFVGMHFLILIVSAFCVYLAILFYLYLCCCPVVCVLGFLWQYCLVKLYTRTWKRNYLFEVFWAVVLENKQALIVSKPILMIYFFYFKVFPF